MTRTSRPSRLRALVAGSLLASLAAISVAPAASAAGSKLTLGPTHLSGTLRGKVMVSIAADGTERVTARLPHIGWPFLSPNGTWIAWATNKGIFVMHPDGSGYRRLVAGIAAQVLAWAPDSRSLLVQTPRLEAQIIHLSNGATRALDPNDNENWNGSSSAFTPDDRYVLTSFYHGWRLQRTSNGAARTFLKAPCRDAAQLAFSPDGKRISFVCESTGALPWSGLLTIATGKITRFGNWQDSSPVWIANGSVAALHASTPVTPQQVRTYDLKGHVLASVNLAVAVNGLYATR